MNDKMLWVITVTFALLLSGTNALAEEVFYLHTDALGSVVVVTDENANVVERREYEPYGLPIIPIADGPGFTSHDMDGESGLVYMQQRYYDPAVGRFLSTDPMAVDGATAGNFNRYNYAANNPYRYTDPDGRTAIVGAAAGCAATGPACPAGAIGGYLIGRAVSVGIVAAGIAVYNEIVEDSAEPSATDAARDRITGGAEPSNVTGTGIRHYDDSPTGESADSVMDDIRGTPGATSSQKEGRAGPVDVVTLPDGGRVIDRNSTSGPRTIEIQDQNGKTTDEVRFPRDELKK